MTLRDWLNGCFSGQIDVNTISYALGKFSQNELSHALDIISEDIGISKRWREISDKDKRELILFYVAVGIDSGVL